MILDKSVIKRTLIVLNLILSFFFRCEEEAVGGGGAMDYHWMGGHDPIR